MTDNFTKDQRNLIKEAIDLTNEFPFATLDQASIVPGYMTKFASHPEILAQIFSDISFKLYIINHSKTDNDFSKLSDYVCILNDLKRYADPKDLHHFSLVLWQIKSAYPLLGDDTVLHELSNFFYYLRVRKKHNIFSLFTYAMRLNSYLTGCSLVIQKFFEVLRIHKARSIEGQPSWSYIGPAFKACAARIKPDFTVNQVGEIFSKYCFYGGSKLEQQIKDHGDWDIRKGEKPLDARDRIRKKHFKNFRNWLKNRENGDLDLEKYLMRFFEETFWNKKSSEQILSPNLNQLAKSNSSPDEIESYMEQVWDFSKKLTLKVNRKKT